MKPVQLAGFENDDDDYDYNMCTCVSVFVWDKKKWLLWLLYIHRCVYGFVRQNVQQKALKLDLSVCLFVCVFVWCVCMYDWQTDRQIKI